MIVRVVYFAIYADLLNKRSEEIELNEPTSISSLFEHCTVGLEDQDLLLKSTVFAVNEEYVDSSRVLNDGDEVVFIPPVSGG